jgi:hypothetical protein
MATSLFGFLGQTNNYSSVNDLITKWPTAAQNQGIKLFGIAFDGVETDYLNPTVISNLTLATNQNPKSWLSYGSSGGIGVPSSYDGWFTDPTKVRAEINHNPNTNQSQVLKLKWADNQDITSATIDLSALSPKTSPGLGDQGNEVGFLQIFNNGVLLPTSNFTITRVNAPSAAKPITLSSDGVTFIGDRTDGSFKFTIEANPLSGITFDELRFSAKPYDSPTAAYLAQPFKVDGSDYLLRNIEYQGTEDPISLQFSNPTFSVNENGTPIAAVTVTRIGSSVGTASATVNLSNGTAIASGDYIGTPIGVNFANGDTAAKTITIPIIDDTLVEGNETVNLSLTNPTGTSRVTLGTQSSATLTIVDNDTLPAGTLQFSSPTFSVNEDGTPIAAVTVTRTGGSVGAVSATVNLSDGTATALTDYNNAPIAVNFANGDTAPKTVTIPIVNDFLIEGNETVNLSLGSPTGGATIGTQNAATLTIVDDDVAASKPLVSVNSLLDPIAGEPFNPEGEGLFQFTRTGGDLSQPLTIRYTVTGTATPDVDYAALLGTVTIAAGEFASDPVAVTTLPDVLNEPTESVIVKVAEDPSYQVNRVGSADTASVTILDDNPLTVTGPSPVLLYDSSGVFINGFSNITDAVAVAIPNDIIVAQPGTYNEPGPILINQPLTLRGPNAGLSPSGTRLPEAVVRTTLGQPVFRINSDDVTIEGFTIQMNRGNAIQQLGAGTDVVIRQNTFTGTGPNSGSVISLNSGTTGFGSAQVIDNLINSVTTTVGSNTSGIQASQFDTVRITDNQIANLTGAGVVADAITNLASAINNKVTNVRQDGIRLQGGNGEIDNNDITNANTSGALTRGGIRLQNSSLFGGPTLGTVDVLSNVITNSVNGVAIASGIGAPNVRINYNDLVGNSRAGLLNDRTVPVDATENWWDSATGPVVGGIGPNRIAGVGASLVTANPFATSVL